MKIEDLAKVNALVGEYQTIHNGLAELDHGGAITGFQIANLVFVQSADIVYPPAMLEAIKTALNAREQAILKELNQYGVTS